MRQLIFNGERLAELRKEKKISQKQLAEMAGLKLSTLSHWENGRIKKPEPENIDKVCKILNIPIESFYIEAEYKKEDKKQFDGKMLRFLRENRGYSQRELAAKIGLKGGEFTISKFENGKLCPKKENIRKFAAIFGVVEESLYKKGEG